MKKDLVSIQEITSADIEEIFRVAKEIKQKQREGIAYTPLKGKTLAMIFQKSSTRTRVSFEVGMYQLGGQAIFLSDNDIQLGRGETIGDTAKVLSRYVNGIMIRTFSQKDVEELAQQSDVPVINGLTDLLHPCQVLADIFTIIEKRGSFRGLKIAYVGDGNNIVNSWIHAAAKLGLHLSLGVPKGYEPDSEIVNSVKTKPVDDNFKLEITTDPYEAVKDADVIYTDVWTSMGQEDEYQKRLKVFEDYQINTELIKEAKKDVLIMHCLPAHRGEEITDEILDGPHSIVIDQAENRLHVQKAILVLLMGN